MTIVPRLLAYIGLTAAAVVPSTVAIAGGSDFLAGDWQVGGIVFVSPKYEGSKSYRFMGAPFIAPAGLADGDGMVQFKGIDDLRFRLLSNQGFEAGPLAGWRFGREEDDGDRLVGLGDVDGGLVVGGYAAYRMGPLAAFASYHHQVTGDETGGLVRFGLEAKSKVQSWLTLTGLVGATWASDDYMDAFFSVSPVQSVNSGLTRFDAESGIKDVHVGLTAEIPLDQQWTIKLSGRYTHLVGDAADSPIVETASQLSGSLGLTYRFSTGR